jgi:hypothetical protein
VKHEGHELWIKCLAGDPKAWAKMKKYNVQDVRLLEELYDKLRPWISGHPNLGLYGDTEDVVCPNCAGDDLERRGFAFTNLGKFQRFRCRACGTWTRSNRREAGVTITQTKD